MAADSRLTRTITKNPIEIPQSDSGDKRVVIPQTTFTSSDNTQKVLLIKKANVGISFCGNAIINGMTVADFIRRFEIDKVNAHDTTEQIAQKLSEYYTEKGTHFFVAGYDSDVPYLFDVLQKTIRRSNIAETPKKGPMQKDVAAGGEQDDIIEVGVPGNLKEPSKEESDKPIIRYGATWAGQMTAITKVVNNSPPLNACWDSMPLKDAIDFAEFLIDTTIKYERFCDDIQTCGGDIDILVITKDEAFWKQHKIYNPQKR